MLTLQNVGERMLWCLDCYHYSPPYNKVVCPPAIVLALQTKMIYLWNNFIHYALWIWYLSRRHNNLIKSTILQFIDSLLNIAFCSSTLNSLSQSLSCSICAVPYVSVCLVWCCPIGVFSPKRRQRHLAAVVKEIVVCRLKTLLGKHPDVI